MHFSGPKCPKISRTYNFKKFPRGENPTLTPILRERETVRGDGREGIRGREYLSPKPPG